MKFFSLTSGILISLASVAAACSSTDTPAQNPTPDGGSSGSSGTGGSATGGSSNTGGKATGGGGGATGGSPGTGGKATGGGGGATGGSAGDGGPDGSPASGGSDGGGGRGQGGAGGAPGDAGDVACVEYCQLEQTKCGFGTTAPAQFANNGECMTACAQYATTGQDGDSSGNTLQCRVTHLNNIPTGGTAALHCPHTGETPTMYCNAP